MVYPTPPLVIAAIGMGRPSTVRANLRGAIGFPK